jgi:Protein of unknown function (DUF4238)
LKAWSDASRPVNSGVGRLVELETKEVVSHKNQHYIPRCYLKAWCDPCTPSKQTPYVWQFSKDGLQVKKKSPDNIFYEKDMYTIAEADGNRNLVLEHGLSGLETQFSLIRDKKLKHRRQLEPAEHLILCAFVAAMDARTKARREHTEKDWGKVVELMDKMREKAKTFTPEQREQARRRAEIDEIMRGDAPTLGEKEARKIASQPMQEMLAPIISTLTPLLSMMEVIIVETSSSPGFITSDSPSVWFDPEAYKRPPLYQAPALMFESTEISLPISPQQMLIFKRSFEPLRGYIRVKDNVVDELNKRTRFLAHEFFIVNSNVKKDFWFDPGADPEDSWDKLHPNPKSPFENQQE